MSSATIFLFLLTVVPLICTPGPDILYTASQGISKGKTAAMRAVAGVLLGYSAHAILSAFGIATVVAASPFLFNALKWFGVAYLAYLAIQMLYSASQKKDGIVLSETDGVSLWKGFFTSFLNPKGLLMYMAILPQFISPEGNAAMQALVLSGIFVASCGVIYLGVALAASRAHGKNMSDTARRKLEAVAGVFLTGAAIKIATQEH
ncbi:LysE family translocator [Enterovibrio norvegicus]|uniref:LysE family translocator n=1 Tax=Enterovibrio TaxID=188143 RepID=UPI000C85965D|nr:LysE family translocator [Enterovibrio norvegicus]PMN64277.1 amino acid transporter [Enterovibrio norvegicus]